MPDNPQRSLIEAAKAGDEAAFRALIEPLRRELRAYAYRMLGGVHDAEDALQDAQRTAWRALESFEAHASFRAWLYRIVTRACLDPLRSRQRRVLPQDVGPAVAPGPPTTEPRRDLAWLEPYPDAQLPLAGDPAAALQLRESVRLAFVRAAQLLPPNQRAALILHDVLGWSADEVAAMLDTTAAAIHSALPRARQTIALADGDARDIDDLDAKEAEAIAQLVRAWETGDFADLAALLADDAVLAMPPWPYWLDGKDAVLAGLQSPATWDGAPRPGRYRLLPTAMNGQPAALAYVRGDHGRYTAVWLTVLTLDADGRIFELTVFVLPELVSAWGYPLTLDGASGPGALQS